MGLVLGRVGVGTPKYSVIKTRQNHVIQEYELSAVTEQMFKEDKDGGFKTQDTKTENNSMENTSFSSEEITLTAQVMTNEKNNMVADVGHDSIDDMDVIREEGEEKGCFEIVDILMDHPHEVANLINLCGCLIQLCGHVLLACARNI